MSASAAKAAFGKKNSYEESTPFLKGRTPSDPLPSPTDSKPLSSASAAAVEGSWFCGKLSRHAVDDMFEKAPIGMFLIYM